MIIIASSNHKPFSAISGTFSFSLFLSFSNISCRSDILTPKYVRFCLYHKLLQVCTGLYRSVNLPRSQPTTVIHILHLIVSMLQLLSCLLSHLPVANPQMAWVHLRILFWPTPDYYNIITIFTGVENLPLNGLKYPSG